MTLRCLLNPWRFRISKPYVVRHQGREEIFIRVGSTSRLATREQQMRLFEIGGMLHTEVMPVPRTDISSLDEARLGFVVPRTDISSLDEARLGFVE